MRLSSARALKTELLETELFASVAAVPSGAVRGTVVASAVPLAARGVSLISVCAVGVAPHGRMDYRIAVRVPTKTMAASTEVDLIRKRAKNEIDIRVTGRIRPQLKLFPRRRHRPTIAGTSVGHFHVTAGTLGYFAERKGRLGFISNNHVLANSNDAAVGDVILQPGALDGGERPGDEIGFLEHFVPIRRTPNFVDCAFAAFHGDDLPGAIRLPDIGKVKGINDDLTEKMRVRKYGRTTGLTRGRVTAFELDNVTVDFEAPLRIVRFDGQIEIEGADEGPFSKSGDSGSLIVDGRRRAVGLLFAGGTTGGGNGKGLTYACPIQTVLDALDARLLE